MDFVELIKTPKVDGVCLRDHQNATIEGRLCITGHHLLLSARQENIQELWLMHKNIDNVEKKPFMVQNSVVGGLIILKCKDLRILSLKIKNSQEYFNVASSLEALSILSNPELEYPFFYRPMYTILEDGYSIFKPELEFSKLISVAACNNVSGSGSYMNPVELNNSLSTSTFYYSNGHDLTATSSATVATEVSVGCEWRITHINKDFKLCPTYGSVLIVPKIITDEQIVQSAAFRDGGRFPVLSYRHANGAALLRSAQPLLVQGIKRCRADEAILNVVLGRSKKGFIVDTWCKGRSNTETDEHYSQWKKVNRSIGNISSPLAILDSFSKLIEACNDISCSPDKWLCRLESCNWLNLVLNSLNAACVVAQCLDQEGSPVLVHGAKGLDSTLIVTSLVQIILHPDCRTMRGIQALIEREWIQAGHPFASRHRYSCYALSQNRKKNSGATFVLFLDCIHQLYTQFPCSFEFSSELLIQLFDHSYFSQYGTFLCDSETERYSLCVHTRTTSLWSYLNRPEVLKNFLNTLYEPNPSVMWPSIAPISLQLWTELYMRWIFDQKIYENTIAQIQDLVTKEKELRTKALKLRKQALDLANEVRKASKSYNIYENFKNYSK